MIYQRDWVGLHVCILVCFVRLFTHNAAYVYTNKNRKQLVVFIRVYIKIKTLFFIDITHRCFTMKIELMCNYFTMYISVVIIPITLYKTLRHIIVIFTL